MTQEPLPKKKLDDLRRFTTHSSKHEVYKIVKAGEAMKKDKAKRDRLRSRECIRCYYKWRYFEGVVGSAFCDRECTLEGCTNVCQSSNTSVPKFCKSCSEEFSICVWCGSDFYDIYEVNGL